ncbi:hypothetical protein VRY85_13800 [Achromobacter sp. F4_2707]|uniref:hypothetical protein n=1 Tax=Achromobacter sp. F4_2707 TaxID=3114286 RepID=UPI0039C6B52E
MKNHAIHKSTEAPQQTITEGKRVFKFPYKRIPVVTSEMWERMENAARVPRKDQRYPVIIEAPDV